MQCPSCQFENMPGTPACGRCGTSLRLATATIDIHPPRAGRWSRMWSGSALQFFRRLWYRIPQPVREAKISLDIRDIEHHLVLRMVVPGWPQWYLGHKIRAALFFFGGLLCACLGILQIGEPAGSLWLGLGLACHMSSIVDIVFDVVDNLRSRAWSFIRCAVFVGAVVYLPISWLTGRYFTPLIVRVPGLEPQVVLVNHRAYGVAGPAVGDVVLYDLPAASLPGGYHRNYLLQGERIDRVLATEGQHVEWQGDDLKVNGQPIAWRPLLPVSPQNLSLTVPPGQLLIAPSTIMRLVPPESAGQVWQYMSLVNREYVQGNAYWRLRPFGQFGPLR